MTTKLTVGLPEAAALMNVHPKTALEIIQSGAIPAAKLGRAYVMMTKDVLAYIEARIVTETTARMRNKV